MNQWLCFLLLDLHDMREADAQICKEISFGFSRYNVQNSKLGCTGQEESQSSSRDWCWLWSQSYPCIPCKKESSKWKRNSWIQNGVYKVYIWLIHVKFFKDHLWSTSLVRSLFCLNPQKMIGLPEECTKAFKIVLSVKLIEAKWRSSSVAYDLLEQYKCLLHVIKKEHDFWVQELQRKSWCLSVCTHQWQEGVSASLECVQTFADNMSQPVNGRKRIQHEHQMLSLPTSKIKLWSALEQVYDAINAMDFDLSSFCGPKGAVMIAHYRYKMYAYRFCKTL